MAQKTGRIQVFESLTPRQHRSTLVGILIFGAIVLSVVNAIANGDTDWRALADNFSTELFGAALTFYIFDLFQERRSDLQLLNNLVREAASKDNVTALKAIDELRAYGWLTNGALQGVNLSNANLNSAELWFAYLKETTLVKANLQRAALRAANLQDADLARANFRSANLLAANLSGANMTSAYLQGAFLKGAELQEAVLDGAGMHRANLWDAKLQGASLKNADLSEANLRNANFEGANLANANFEGANLQDAQFNEDTLLPDDDPQGQRSEWTPETDMQRFTNPDHAYFWRPEPGSVWWYPDSEL